MTYSLKVSTYLVALMVALIIGLMFASSESKLFASIHFPVITISSSVVLQVSPE